MIITLTPQRRDERLELSKRGDVLTDNGADFDFSGVAEGVVLRCEEVACA